MDREISMETRSLEYLSEAIETLQDYLPLLEHQDRLNGVVLSHCVDALEREVKGYQKDYVYGRLSHADNSCTG